LEAAMAATTKKTKKAKKKTAKKKAAPKRRRHTITIKCRGGFCTATPHVLRVHVGDTVVWKAVGTGVDVSFRSSPFKVKKFRIESGKQKATVVVNGPGTFQYSKRCDDCPNPALPPRIIVE
jgi:plastocyanin